MIRKLFIGLCLLLGLGQLSTAKADVYVHGYFKGDGTYVQPYFRSSPDSSLWNNYSTQGNVNPYTGALGTKSPYGFSVPFGLPTYAPVFPSFTSPYFPSPYYSPPSFLPAYTPPVFPAFPSFPTFPGIH